MSRALLHGLFAAALLSSCHPRVGPARDVPRLGGDVVALVGETAIRRADVAARARARGLDARRALHSLEEDALLEAAARARGLEPSDLDHRRRQVLVQLLLRSVERRHPPESVDADAVTRRAAALAPTMRRPERRAVIHLLVRPASNDTDARVAAEGVARRALALASAEPHGDATLERVAERLRNERIGLDVTVERLPTFAAEGGYERPFEQEVFARATPGLVDHPVHTSFGVHAIDVVRIEPAYTPTDGELEVRARELELDAVRAAAVDELLTAVRRRTDVQVRDEAVRRLLSDDDLFRGVR